MKCIEIRYSKALRKRNSVMRIKDMETNQKLRIWNVESYKFPCSMEERAVGSNHWDQHTDKAMPSPL